MYYKMKNLFFLVFCQRQCKAAQLQQKFGIIRSLHQELSTHPDYKGYLADCICPAAGDKSIVQAGKRKAGISLQAEEKVNCLKRCQKIRRRQIRNHVISVDCGFPDW